MHDENDPLFPVLPAEPEALAAHLASLSVDELTALEADFVGRIREVASSPDDFASDDYPAAQLIADTRAARDTLNAIRAELSDRPDEPVEEPEEVEDEPTAEELAAEFAAIGAEVGEPDLVEEPEDVAEQIVEPEPVVAATEPPTRMQVSVRRPLPRPARSRASAPAPAAPSVGLTAAAGGLGFDIGADVPDLVSFGHMVMARRRQFGDSPAGNDRYPIAKANWAHLYPDERRLGGDIATNMALIAAATNPADIKAELRRRRNSLTAAGGWCALSTPYYNLANISTVSRPVRDSLPGFAADRGGIRAASPASLAAITTAVGQVTAADDALGGTFATKACQTIDCPEFVETLADALYHCLQFGNMASRAFPELVAQWGDLTMAAQARWAESFLLSRIDAESTHVTAASTIGLGASGALLGQILAAANGMRSRHRMDPEAVLRLLLPDWSIDLLISDVIRGQFQRFETDEARITALLRSFDVEPTFYVDGASGRSQVFGTQSAGALLAFPSTVNWFLYPEGSFIHLDAGSLELGTVRDSVLNLTNDFQLFGETFENVAYVGVESLAVASTVCDSGTVSLPHAVTCPVTY